MRTLVLLAGLGLLGAVLHASAADYFLYVGTYTGKGSQGIYAWRFNPDTGKITEIGLAGETTNPSFVALHPNGRYLYAANEVGKGTVSAFAVDAATGKLTPLNSVPSRGSGPCHMSVDKAGRNLLVANYSSGTVAAIRIGEDGRLGESTGFAQHQGSGPNTSRQKEPHAHSINISPNQKYVIAADLGTDQLYVYRFDAATGSLTPNEPASAKSAPGAGPRHFSFHPDGKHAFAINELNSTVTAYTFDSAKGTLTEIGSASTLPSDWKGQNTTAEVVVHPNGKFVYGSNRGHDSVAVLRFEGGKLTPVEQVSTQGRTPRNFVIDPTGKYLFAANQQTNDIAVFRVDAKTGKLTPTGEKLSVVSPVCVRFLKASR